MFSAMVSVVVSPVGELVVLPERCQDVVSLVSTPPLSLWAEACLGGVWNPFGDVWISFGDFGDVGDVGDTRVVPSCTTSMLIGISLPLTPFSFKGSFPFSRPLLCWLSLSLASLSNFVSSSHLKFLSSEALSFESNSVSPRLVWMVPVLLSSFSLGALASVFFPKMMVLSVDRVLSEASAVPLSQRSWRDSQVTVASGANLVGASFVLSGFGRAGNVFACVSVCLKWLRAGSVRMLVSYPFAHLVLVKEE